MEIRIKTADEFRDAHVVIEIRAEEDEDIRVRPLVDERLYTASEVGTLQASEAELVSAPLQAALAERADRIAELKGEIRRMDHQISGQTERASQLDRRNAQLTEELIRRTHERDEREKARADLETETNERIMGHIREADQLRTKIRELNQAVTHRADLADELAHANKRAADNREWAERAESCVADLTRKVNDHAAELACERERRVRDLELVERQRDDHAADLSVAKRKLDKAQHTIETLSDQLDRISGAVHSPEIVKAMNPMYCAPEIAMLRKTIDQVRDALGSPSLLEDAGGPTSQA